MTFFGFSDESMSGFMWSVGQLQSYSGIREALKANQEICKRRNELYEKQKDLKGKLFKIEKEIER